MKLPHIGQGGPREVGYGAASADISLAFPVGGSGFEDQVLTGQEHEAVL